MINNWFKKSEALPRTGSMVVVVTDADRTYDAYFENFLGNEIWETSSNFDDTEKYYSGDTDKRLGMLPRDTQNQ